MAMSITELNLSDEECDSSSERILASAGSSLISDGNVAARGTSSTFSSFRERYQLRFDQSRDADSIDPNSIDRYGFIIDDNSSTGLAATADPLEAHSRNKIETLHAKQSLKKKLSRIFRGNDIDAEQRAVTHESLRNLKWQDMCQVKTDGNQFGNQEFSFPRTGKLESRIFKGIPDPWRSVVWAYSLRKYMASDQKSNESLIRFYFEAKDRASASDTQLDLDVPRTISKHIFFYERFGSGQSLLFWVLHAISLAFPQIGYVQGMSSLAAVLLCYYTQETAFVIMHRMFTLRGILNLYEKEFSYLMESFADLQSIISRKKIGRHLQKLGIETSCFATKWYLTLFSVSLPFRTQMRIWDVFMYFGKDFQEPVQLLHLIALAILQYLSPVLISSDFNGCMTILTGFIHIKNDDLLLGRIKRYVQRAIGQGKTTSS